MGSQLLTLPDELLVEVLKHLDAKHLLRCRLACKSMSVTIKNSLQLQYNIELEADGLVDGYRCPLSLAERYVLLMQRRRRWRDLDWSKVVSITAPAMCQAYELVDGVFASSMHTGFGASRHLSLTWLPTSREPARKIERDDMGALVCDFAIDPSQDLIALVVSENSNGVDELNLSVQLRTLSDNKPHPEAAVKQLHAPIPFVIGTSFIQIVDDVVGVFFWLHGPGLVIWNWRTGKAMVTVSAFDLPVGTYDFAFLSSRAYMITVASGHGSIVIYAFGGDEEVSTSSRDQSHAMADNSCPTKVAVLELPPVKPGKTLDRFETHSGPFVARPTPGRPFETSPDCKLHVMELRYAELPYRFHMFVRNRYLLSYVPSGIGSGATYTAVTKRWDEWGPDHTRFIPIMGRFQWLRYVHGERVILLSVMVIGILTPTARTVHMTMLDFNVHPKRLDDPVPLKGWTGTAMCNLYGKTRPMDREEVFQHTVVSSLPYVTRMRKLPEVEHEYSGFMIDHDHLVGMRVRPSLKLRSCLNPANISGITAHHVLGGASVTLGAGDLNIMSASGGGRDLTLTVGGAAFSLDSKTEFGTLEDDPRTYVFQPDIEGVQGGYVKLTLPEGVTEDGSRLSDLQTRFEEILIEHGLLQPAEEASARKRIKDAIASQTSEPLVTIPGVIIAQVLGEETTILAHGKLFLDVIPDSEENAGKPLLTLSVGRVTLPLFSTTTFGTLANDSPAEQPHADLAELQNRFELALIEYGLLKDGFEAAADEVGRSIREDSARVARRIREARDLYLKTHPPTVDPVQFSKAAHNVTGSSVSGTQSLANAAHWVSGALTSAAASAGAWIAGTLVPTEPKATEQLDSAARSVSAVVGGVAEGTKEVKDTLKDAAGAVVENDYGKEARNVAGNVGQSVNNVSAVAGDVATVTSGAALAIAGLQGAASRQNEEQRAAGMGGPTSGTPRED
ncbi:hypothetical protein BD414DRAFT_517035 [Trametes punicea]|nr:hypothetical protein BD414DRAFT_517035 [Trametes punicea]